MIKHSTRHSIKKQAFTFQSVNPGSKNQFLKLYLQAYQNIWTYLFIAVLFVTAKWWEQPKCPHVGEQLNPVQPIPWWNTIHLWEKNEEDLYELIQNDSVTYCQVKKSHVQNITDCRLSFKWETNWYEPINMDLFICAKRYRKDKPETSRKERLAEGVS